MPTCTAWWHGVPNTHEWSAISVLTWFDVGLMLPTTLPLSLAAATCMLYWVCRFFCVRVNQVYLLYLAVCMCWLVIDEFRDSGVETWHSAVNSRDRCSLCWSSILCSLDVPWPHCGKCCISLSLSLCCTVYLFITYCRFLVFFCLTINTSLHSFVPSNDSSCWITLITYSKRTNHVEQAQTSWMLMS